MPESSILLKSFVKCSYINTLNICVANFQPQQFSDYKSEHFDDAAVQPENSYYDPVPKI